MKSPGLTLAWKEWRALRALLILLIVVQCLATLGIVLLDPRALANASLPSLFALLSAIATCVLIAPSMTGRDLLGRDRAFLQRLPLAPRRLASIKLLTFLTCFLFYALTGYVLGELALNFIGTPRAPVAASPLHYPAAALGLAAGLWALALGGCTPNSLVALFATPLVLGLFSLPLFLLRPDLAFVSEDVVLLSSLALVAYLIPVVVFYRSLARGLTSGPRFLPALLGIAASLLVLLGAGYHHRAFATSAVLREPGTRIDGWVDASGRRVWIRCRHRGHRWWDGQARIPSTSLHTLDLDSGEITRFTDTSWSHCAPLTLSTGGATTRGRRRLWLCSTRDEAVFLDTATGETWPYSIETLNRRQVRELMIEELARTALFTDDSGNPLWFAAGRIRPREIEPLTGFGLGGPPEGFLSWRPGGFSLLRLAGPEAKNPREIAWSGGMDPHSGVRVADESLVGELVAVRPGAWLTATPPRSWSRAERRPRHFSLFDLRTRKHRDAAGLHPTDEILDADREGRLLVLDDPSRADGGRLLRVDPESGERLPLRLQCLPDESPRLLGIDHEKSRAPARTPRGRLLYSAWTDEAQFVIRVDLEALTVRATTPHHRFSHLPAGAIPTQVDILEAPDEDQVLIIAASRTVERLSFDQATREVLFPPRP